MKSLIIGDGEIGEALWHILGGDMTGKTNEPDQYDIIHIAFPYTDGFVNEVKRYQKLFKPRYTVIHSTVPVGTSRKVGAIHSPCIGVHPFLEESMKAFDKFLGGEVTGELWQYFKEAGIKVYIFDKPETTELMKLECTSFYGMCVDYTRDVKEQCLKYGVPFEAWTIWNDNYNKGYRKLGQSQFVRPNLIPVPGKIGGHCVIPNTELIDTKFTKFLKKL